MKLEKKNIKSGFTLIEMMISVTLFTIIITIGVGAVLNSNQSHKKTQTMRSILDSMSFVMEEMARNIRLGNEYACASLSDCSTDSTSDSGIDFTDVTGKKVSYEFLQDLNNKIVLTKTIEGELVPSPLTPPEVEIDAQHSGFIITGQNTDDNMQPKVTLFISGKVKLKDTTTNFNLQTTVSQRLLD